MRQRRRDTDADALAGVPRYVAIGAAAAHLGLGATTLRQAVARGEIAALRTERGGAVRLSVESLVSWVRARTHEARA